MTKAAIVVLSETKNHADLARVVNALETVKELKDAGDEVELIFDGGGVTSAVTLAEPCNGVDGLFLENLRHQACAPS